MSAKRPMHVRADRLALVGAGHAHRDVGRDAEVVRPEPHQPLDEPDLRRERRIEARLHLALEDLLRHRFGSAGIGAASGLSMPSIAMPEALRSSSSLRCAISRA